MKIPQSIEELKAKQRLKQNKKNTPKELDFKKLNLAARKNASLHRYL